jgi:hypothetical protein
MLVIKIRRARMLFCTSSYPYIIYRHLLATTATLAHHRSLRTLDRPGSVREGDALPCSSSPFPGGTPVASSSSTTSNLTEHWPTGRSITSGVNSANVPQTTAATRTRTYRDYIPPDLDKKINQPCSHHQPSSRFPRCRSVSSDNTYHHRCLPMSTPTHRSSHHPASPRPRGTTR